MTRTLTLSSFAVLLLACSNGTPEPKPATTPASAPAPAPAATAPEPAAVKGTVETHSFASASLGVDKNYVVYLPAGYASRPDVRYPVFYYLHGLTGNETNWVKGGALDAAADAIGLAAIVVMPDGDDGFYTDAATNYDYDACMKDGTGLFIPGQPRKETCVRKRNYETYIVKDLLSEIDTHYRTIATREGRAIAGLSMGGFGALELSMRHPDLFAAAASHSGVAALLYEGPYPYEKGKVKLFTKVQKAPEAGGEILRWLNGIFGDKLENWRAHDPAALVAKLEPGKPALYLDCGTEDIFKLDNGAAYVHDLLLDRKIDHAFYIGPGRHDFTFWKPRLPESLKFLRDHTAPATSSSK